MAKQLNEGREEKAATETTETIETKTTETETTETIETKTTETKTTETKFTKKQLVSCKRYRDRRDILNALLTDGEDYTHSEAEKMIEDFMKGGVS